VNLPNYFLADLPPEATLNGQLIQEACQTLKRNRERYLLQRTTQNLVNTLCQVAKNWLAPDYSLRKLVLEEGPAATGFQRATLALGLEPFFRQLTPENFEALLKQDLGHPCRLDQMSGTETERKGNRVAMVTAPELLVHLTAGNLPNPTLMSMVLGVLARSAQFVKCARGAAFVPRLFAHSLYEQEPKLGACLEIAEWRGGRGDLESALFEEADLVTVTGTDETVAEVRQRLPAKIRLLAYGHRVSFGYVAEDVLAGGNGRKIAALIAADVAAWNQQGCLSPHVIFVQEGAVLSPELFAEMVSEELDRVEQTHPRGELPVTVAAAIASRRSLYEVRSAHSPDTRHWCSKGSTVWTVVYEADPRFQTSCLNRFLYLKPVQDLTAALQAADSVRGKVSTVGLAALPQKTEELAAELARWGVTRVCPLGQMQNPPFTWRHDGRPTLGDLVTWTDWER
jgi:hypothetical protein